MDIRLFREFIVLAKVLNYHTASEQLHISQSALSRHIALLETDFGVKLFTRDRYQVNLTKQGAAFYDEAFAIWQAYEHAKRVAHDLACAGLSITLSGVLEAPSFYRCVRMTEHDVAGEIPGFSLHLDKNSPSIKQQIRLIQSGDVTCASVFYATSCVKDHPELASSHLCDVPMDVILHQDDPLASRASVSLAELQDKRLVQFIGEQHSPVWRSIKFEFDHRGIPYAIKPVYAPSLYELYRGINSITPDEAVVIYRNYFDQDDAVQGQESPTSIVTVPIEDFSLSLDLINLATNTGGTMECLVRHLQQRLADKFAS